MVASNPPSYATAAGKNSSSLNPAPGAAADSPPANASVSTPKVVPTLPGQNWMRGRLGVQEPSNNATSEAGVSSGAVDAVTEGVSQLTADAATDASPFKTSSDSVQAPEGGQKDKEQPPPPPPTMLDQTYARQPPHEKPDKHDKFIKVPDIRVNQFKIDRDSLPKVVHRYSITFPVTAQGHALKNPRVKRVIISQIMPSLEADVGANNVYTDWKTSFIARLSLHDPKGNEILLDTPSAPFEIPPLSQTANTTPADNLKITLNRLDDLHLSRLYAHIDNPQSQTFNFLPYTDALNIMSKHFSANTTAHDMVPLATKDKLFEAQHETSLGKGLHARRAFFNSVRPVLTGIHLHANALASTFVDDKDLHVFYNERRKEMSFREFRSITNGLLVQRRYATKVTDPTTTLATINAQPHPQGPLKRINGYGEAARSQKFKMQDGSEPTVQQYFVTLGVTLYHAHLPVVNIGGNDDNKKAWVPMEMLHIANDQRSGRMLEGNQTTVMIDFARKDPRELVDLISNEGMARLDQPQLRTAGVMSIATKMATTLGLRLQAPKLLYSNKYRPADGSGGKWDLRGQEFQKGATLDKLRVIHIAAPHKVKQLQFRPSQDQLAKFASDLGTNGLQSSGGPQAARDVTRVFASNATPDELTNALRQTSPPQVGENVVILVIFEYSLETYANVKRWADALTLKDAGLHTVCVTQEKVNQLTNAVFRTNLAVKMNAKLGGINHTLQNQGQTAGPLLHHGAGDTMFVGADVTHPGPGSAAFTPSIAGVVASVDRNAVQYPGSMRLQEGRVEEIKELREMMKERLRAWYDNHKIQKNRLPANILFYRDGVSESQFPMVKDSELQQVKTACDEFARANQPGWSPKITLVVCTKRHQTRFFEPEKENANIAQCLDGDGGFKPGLLVDDSSVRLPFYYDFFLQSHATIKGTARPCHYFVIENGMNLGPRTLQKITFNLCWLYATATTPISMVAPAYYADKLCERGRAYIRPLLKVTDDSPDTEAWVAGLPENMTIEQKRAWVAQQLGDQQIVGNRHLWPHPGPNPTAPKLQNSMFYI